MRFSLSCLILYFVSFTYGALHKNLPPVNILPTIPEDDIFVAPISPDHEPSLTGSQYLDYLTTFRQSLLEFIQPYEKLNQADQVNVNYLQSIQTSHDSSALEDFMNHLNNHLKFYQTNKLPSINHQIEMVSKLPNPRHKTVLKVKASLRRVKMIIMQFKEYYRTNLQMTRTFIVQFTTYIGDSFNGLIPTINEVNEELERLNDDTTEELKIIQFANSYTEIMKTLALYLELVDLYTLCFHEIPVENSYEIVTGLSTQMNEITKLMGTSKTWIMFAQKFHLKDFSSENDDQSLSKWIVGMVATGAFVSIGLFTGRYLRNRLRLV